MLNCVLIDSESDQLRPPMQSPMPTKMLEPKSNPTYYKDLLRELEEAPKRSWFGRIAKRLGGMIRLT